MGCYQSNLAPFSSRSPPWFHRAFCSNVSSFESLKRHSAQVRLTKSITSQTPHCGPVSRNKSSVGAEAPGGVRRLSDRLSGGGGGRGSRRSGSIGYGLRLANG